MSLQDFETNLICHSCKVALVRVPQAVYPIAETKPDDAIICPSCGALGVYKEVSEEGGGLNPGVLTKEERAKIIEKLRITPDSL